MKHTVVLIPGDGIGPEVAEAVRRILEAARAQIEWTERYAGLAAIERGAKDVLPEETVKAIVDHGVALKGPCTTPIGGGFSSINVALRKLLSLYGAVRPVRSMKGVPTRYEDVDLIVVRENTEGLYSGIENVITPGVITSLKVATEPACRRIAKFAFEYAMSRGRKKITCLHKANIMKLTDGLFIRCAREEHERAYAEKIAYEELIIDAACMKLVQNPSQFDVVLCENLYGDLISDLCAGMVGGLGVTPGANFGEKHAVFEAVHGSAPDIAGQNKANPLALLMSAVMMLRHLAATRNDKNCEAVANRIREAYNACLLAGEKTRDLGGNLGTMEFASAVVKRLG
ncbi:MAG: isocitrate/isopropylmalate family dehydrogenase [Phycisphaerales bacterium]|nr:isocitrate/isopropylmalate family dehydrogenase [Phycisphaerales bacterium]MCI0675803.1 isocitrate/isopropylmalate family dehydrogenase [Phycisphaerales bacterium]